MASLNNLFQIFLPKDKVFFAIFEKTSANLKVMAEHLSELCEQEEIHKMKEYFIKLEELELQNDELTHELFIQLGKNFITPYDREDIHYLATSIDDVADYIYASAKMMISYKVLPKSDPFIHRFNQYISEGINTLCTAINGLNSKENLQEVYKNLVHINSIENYADNLLDECMSHLFETERDPINLIKKKEIYQMLEIITDKFEDASNVIESILIKYA